MRAIFLPAAATLTGAALAVLVPAMAAAQGAAPTQEEIMQAWRDSPHALSEAEAFRHWDAEGMIPPACAICHSGTGALDYLGADGSAAGSVDHPVTTGSVIDCAVCHNLPAQALQSVTFPSGVAATGLGASAICAVCHQGRQSTDGVDAAVASLDPDAVSSELGFLNVHYRAAAATLLGSEVRGGYQYEGRDYVGRFAHVPQLAICTDCHDAHSTVAETAGCATCHAGIDGPEDIRVRQSDFDGDGDAAEGIHGEIATLHRRLGQAIAAYGAEIAGAPIVYDAHNYPYFFNDLDGSGAAEAAEAAYPNRYQSWTPRLLRAAYNYQFVAKDPGGYAHNPAYLLQLLHDSLADLGTRIEVDMAGMSRP